MNLLWYSLLLLRHHLHREVWMPQYRPLLLLPPLPPSPHPLLRLPPLHP
jgi:hypothetical protein